MKVRRSKTDVLPTAPPNQPRARAYPQNTYTTTVIHLYSVTKWALYRRADDDEDDDDDDDAMQVRSSC